VGQLGWDKESRALVYCISIKIVNIHHIKYARSSRSCVPELTGTVIPAAMRMDGKGGDMIKKHGDISVNYLLIILIYARPSMS
jgi:hypothetical protein